MTAPRAWPKGKLPWAPTQVNIDIKEQDPKTGEEGSIASQSKQLQGVQRRHCHRNCR